MMAEKDAIEVEAHVIDADLMNPTIYDNWLAEQRQKVDNALAECKRREVVTADDYRGAKASRAELRRVIGEVDAERKARTAELEKLLKRVRGDVNAVLDEARSVDASLKSEIDAYTERANAAKMDEVRRAYTEYAPALADIVPFEKIEALCGIPNKWHNKNTNVETCKQQMYAFVDGIAADEKTLGNFACDGDERVELKAEFFDTLDLNAAVKHVLEKRERKKQVEALETERKSWQQPAREATKQQGNKQPTAVIVEVRVPVSRFAEFKDSMLALGIHGKPVRKEYD